ncbi:helix-turn-helix domain-containing protein [Fulvivirga ulvae]|uniref:helix-turn-helix domain-containing protein n=1 Tax=Fulvivirga ulvae TaxID=2904245 RepID=UPI001F200496|nr:helix-turn-helix domain-containing protein [Fulvivirga ulvae]UII33745.1 helix-turn-helix domain-containing protein [Fulvivirga ulvae]
MPKEILYQRLAPLPDLADFVECLWVVEAMHQSEVQVDKIIPDGYVEIIFHYGDHYEIKTNKLWEKQALNLLAGQIDKHFFLRNTQRIGMLGIKFKPLALTELFGINMQFYVNRVVDLSEQDVGPLKEIVTAINSMYSYEEMMEVVQYHLLHRINQADPQKKLRRAIELIMQCKGTIKIGQLAQEIDLSERQTERLFARYVGLTPKCYARILQFNNIFDLMKTGDPSWSDIVHDSGYFDQSHFIKAFKYFTGVDPSRYIFEQPGMANFFLEK